MKKIIPLFLVCIFIFSCTKDLELSDNIIKDQSTGSIFINIDSNSGNREFFNQKISKTISTNMTIVSYNITITGPGNIIISINTTDATVLIENLQVGEWTIIIDAINDEGVAIGIGQNIANVNRADITEVNINIQPYAGTGNIDITVTWDASLVSNPIIIASLLLSTDTLPVNLTFTINSTAGQAVYHANDVDSGYYTLNIELYDGSTKLTGAAEVVRITNEQTTSATINFIVEVVPVAPSNLTSTAVSTSQINLFWTNNSTNELGFKVERRISSETTFAEIVGDLPAGTTSYNDAGLNADTTYYYRVRAYNVNGNSGYSEESGTATFSNPATIQIIADHTIVDDYDNIPASYMTEVKKMMVCFPGESHSAAYRTGMELLETANSAYACNVSTGEVYTDQYVRVNTGAAGEATWYTWYAYDSHNGTNKDVIKNYITQYVNNGYPMHAIGFGWCWDMTWTNNPGGTVDPVYNVRWAGSSEGGPDGNLRWGLDASDYTLTGNRVCMDTYLYATENYRLYCQNNGYPTKVIFTTGPADGASGENGYQRHLKHEYIRTYVKANSERILFDYADILCYDNGSLTPNIISWTDGGGIVHEYPVITSNNLGDGTIGHIGSAGAIRLAKAQWWMLARIAGWDGLY